MNNIQALELAYAKGNLKKWALERILLETLYGTTLETCSYTKLVDLSNLDFDEETETEYIVKFGYLYRIPKTEVDLHIVKRNGKLYLSKEGIGWGYDQVEKEVLKYLFEQKKKGNLYLQTNLNNLSFKIK